MKFILNIMKIKFEDFEKLEIRIGKILSVEKVEGADKLLKFIIDFGKEKRQIIGGLAEFFEPEYFIGKEVPVLVNLEPRKFMGLESQGMLLVVDDEKPVLLVPEKEVRLGSLVR